VNVAIIGMSGKFPAADHYDQFWQNLITQQSSITEVPAFRWDWRQFWGDPKTQSQKSLSKWGGFIEDVAAFDAGFFGILPKVAHMMDPQQRLVLEQVWSCLEDAGIAPASLRGRKVGVMLGVFNHDYKESQDVSDAPIEAHYSTGTAAAIIANRVSHFFDFHGPSFPIDTACSSSLNAIHSAIQALQYGDCEMAIAGGVNLLLTPTRHISFSRMGMLSPTGQCRTFDAAANGYVRGEGVGVLLLKPLAQALADGDAIHAVIKGSAVNHCGETYTLTYPSPQAQAEVIAAAHRRAEVPVETVNYVEAHGTGTPKGDPIEFQGLLQAYQTLAAEQQTTLTPGFCALSSVKTNIGHLEAAAGVAGVIKVVLAMRHQQLPPLQNYSALNPAIPLADSPFSMVTTAQPWPQITDANQQVLPLRAGISSFGFGGTNAHVVLESFQSSVTTNPAPPFKAAVLLALSAKSAAALAQQKSNLLSWLERHPQQSLLDVSAGLLQGRDHHQYRFGLVVKDRHAAIEALQAALADSQTPVAINRDDVALLAEVNQQATQLLSKIGRPRAHKTYVEALTALAACYLKGADPQWSLLFAHRQIQRVRLPVYPFQRQHYWLAAPQLAAPKPVLPVSTAQAEANPSPTAPVRQHPLLQQQWQRQGQTSVQNAFTGQEFFLADHQIQGRPVFPAAAYLETLCAACQPFMPTADCSPHQAPSPVLEIADVVWLKPFSPADGMDELRLNLHSQEQDQDQWRCEFISATATQQLVKNCQAKVRWLTQAPPTQINGLGYPAEDWQDGSPQHFYQQFAAAGFGYGPSHQTISWVAQQPTQLLLKLTVPTVIADTASTYQLHPAVIDGALQGAVALLMARNSNTAASIVPQQPWLPFSLTQLQVYGATGTEQWAWIRLKPEAQSGASVKLDIDLFRQLPAADDRCELIASFTGLGLRPLATESATRAVTVAAPIQPTIQPTTQAPAATRAASFLMPSLPMLHKDNPMAIADSYYSPHWFEQALTFNHQTASAQQSISTLLVLGHQTDLDRFQAAVAQQAGFSQLQIIWVAFAERFQQGAALQYQVRAGHEADMVALAQSLAAAQCVPAHVVNLVDAQQATTDINLRLQQGAESSFALVKAWFKVAKTARFVHLVTAATTPYLPVEQALSAFYKTVKVERPAYQGRVVVTDGTVAQPELLATLLLAELTDSSPSTDVRYVGTRRLVREFVSVAQLPTLPEPRVGFRTGGVYLITGGLGALGLLVARYLLQHYQAKVVLTGRSALSAEKQQLLHSLDPTAQQLQYLSCDICDLSAVQAMVTQLAQRGLALNGVLHSAGVIEDNFILRKDFAAFQRVISPKVRGTLNLDLATREQPLDLFVLFSSVTGVLGNLGQCDYAYGNAFEDYFSLQRNALAAQGECSGHAVSINWPYWQDGGMVLSAAETEILRKNFGLVPLQNELGLQALAFAVTAGVGQLAVLPGDATKVQQVLGVRPWSADACPDLARLVTSPSLVASSAIAASVAVDAHATVTDVALSAAALKTQAVAYLRTLFAKTVQLPAEQFELQAPFAHYGFDSVVMVDLVIELEQDFTGLPATLFFEYQNLSDLADYFVKEHTAFFAAQPSATRPSATRPSATQPSATQPSTTTQTATPAATVNLASAETPSVSPAPVSLQHAPQLVSPASATQDCEDIAIIGVSGRYPQAQNLSEFWHNLSQGVDCIEEIPADRGWDLASLWQPGPVALGKSYAKWGGFLTDIDQFDPLFFGISPAEAELMDPSERLMLETVALAIEDAGYQPDRLAAAGGDDDHPVGVYVGNMWGDYQLYGVDGDKPKTMVAPRSWYWAVANRISYQFNFSGPSIVVDTACSSSLTALHLACEALKRGEVAVAIAGGVNLTLHPQKYNSLCDLHFLSTDGRCRSFGEGGDGYVPAEGVGAVILKRYVDACRDGDHIYAVIKGTALNHGGKTSGFTVPNPNRQGALIKTAIQRAGVDPRHISYVEAHGTGTSLGDPIEIAGLSKAFAEVPLQSCAIGSVKSNIGHAEAAAGIAGISKILLQLKHRMLVPSLHSTTLNPYLKMAQSPFFVLQAAQPWRRPVEHNAETGERIELPLLAGLSSFGAGGANAHVILAEYPPEQDPRRQQRRQAGPHLVLLSARRDSALQQMAAQLLAFITREPAVELADLAYTLQTGRVHYEFGLALVAADLTSLHSQLTQFLRSGAHPAAGIFSGKRPRTPLQTDAAAEQLRLSLQQRDLVSLATAWLAGQHPTNWQDLYSQGSAFRIAVPGYVYSRQRYWVNPPAAATQQAALSSLLDRNVSTLQRLQYEKTLDAQQFYLKDHQLGQKAVLPGVVYLEMARQAAQLAVGAVAALADIRWLKPVVVGAQAETVQLALTPAADALQFELSKTAATGLPLLYCTGKVLPTVANNSAKRYASPPALNLLALQQRCESLSASHIETGFRSLGFAFGPSFQVMQNLYCNHTEALAALVLPAALRASSADFVLHPALLDGVLRTAVGIGGFAPAAGLPLPVSLDWLQIHQPLTTECFSYAQLAAQQPAAAQQTAYNIFVYSGQAELLVSLYGFVTQRVHHLATAVPAGASAKPQLAAPLSPAVHVVASNGVASNGVASNAVAPVSALELARHYLTDLVATVTKVSVAQIDPTMALEHYGIDSVMIMAMNEKLEAVCGAAVPKTLFFEYPDIQSLAQYLAEHYGPELEAVRPMATPMATPMVMPALQSTTQSKVLPTAQRSAVPPISAPVASPAISVQAPTDSTAVHQFLCALLARVTKIDPSQLDMQVNIEQYGVDSVMIMAMNEALEQQYGADIPKTLFFEYQTLADLADYLLTHHPTQFPATAHSNNLVAMTEAQARYVLPSATTQSDAVAEATPAQYWPPLPSASAGSQWTATEQLKHSINALSDAEVERLLQELQSTDALIMEF
jgi:polyketide synthase PksN